MSDLDRFLKAQESDYQTALKQIKNGKKVSCWMWYIFPQIVGLGMTQMSTYYGIKNIEEAIDYLKNEILKKRLIEISQALLDLDEEDDDIREIMGYPDDLKLRSSMTLFKKAEEFSGIDCENIFNKVLERYYKGEEDNRTLTILEKQKYQKDKENNYNEDNNSSKEEKQEKQEKDINDEDNELNEDKKEDNKINKETNNITNNINNENNDDINENKIQNIDSIETISEESLEKSDNNEQENISEKEKNEENNNINEIKKEKIDEFLNKSETKNKDEKENDKIINNDENEIISHVKNDRIPNLKNDDENNDENKLKCSFCSKNNICNII